LISNDISVLVSLGLSILAYYMKLAWLLFVCQALFGIISGSLFQVSMVLNLEIVQRKMSPLAGMMNIFWRFIGIFIVIIINTVSYSTRVNFSLLKM
jgi:MFS family permease